MQVRAEILRSMGAIVELQSLTAEVCLRSVAPVLLRVYAKVSTGEVVEAASAAVVRMLPKLPRAMVVSEVRKRAAAQLCAARASREAFRVRRLCPSQRCTVPCRPLWSCAARALEYLEPLVSCSCAQARR
jgi:hypothetical protein